MSSEKPVPLVELDGVGRKVWISDDNELVILSAVDLVVFAGDHIGIVGRSGTGKSTLLNLLGLLDQPSHGVMRWEGQDAQGFSNRRAARLRGKEIGFVFQQFNLLPKRSALENVMAPLMYADGPQFWSRRRIATQMLELVGLGDRLHSDPVNLSGGEQQRVAIARALVRSPRLVLADEPTGALDVETGQQVMGLLDQITKERSMALITITHDPAIAALARRRYRLADGILTPITHERALDETARPETAPTDPAPAEMAPPNTAELPR